METETMLFHTPHKNPLNINLHIDGNPIQFVNEFNYLGIFLDSNLTWKPHITYIYICKKISRNNGVFAKLKHMFPSHILRTLYN